MADTVANETDNIENQPNDANCDVPEPLKKGEVTETPTVNEAGDADNKSEEPVSEEADETASRKRKSEAGTVPDEDEEESKKAKTDEVPPTNGSEAESNDQTDVTTKTVEDVKRLAGEGDEEVAA
jgi:hypothetical protein